MPIKLSFYCWEKENGFEGAKIDVIYRGRHRPHELTIQY